MSHLTKQQLTDIAKHLNLIGVKDSQFKEITAEAIKESAAIPLVIDGESGKENKRISTEEFITYLSAHLDLTKIKIDIDGIEYTLYQLLHIDPSGQDDNLGFQTDAGRVGYSNVETLGIGAKSVQTVLDLILSILYGHDRHNNPVSFPTAAESTDIVDVLTTNLDS